MKSFLGKILCFLKLHRWEYHFDIDSSTHEDEYVLEFSRGRRECQRCRRYEETDEEGDLKGQNLKRMRWRVPEK